MCVWWSIRGVVYFAVLKPGQTVNADLFCEQLDLVNQSLIEKCLAIVNGKGVILQHNNARPHCKRQTLEKGIILPNILDLYCAIGFSFILIATFGIFSIQIYIILAYYYISILYIYYISIQTAIFRYFAQKPIDFFDPVLKI